MGWAQNVPTTHTNTSNECYCYPCSLKIAKFYRQGESETLSLKNMSAECKNTHNTTKLGNFSQIATLFWGIVAQISD